MKTILNYIDGELRAAKSGKTLDVFDPSRGSVYATAPDSEIEDVELAVAAASNAFEQWSETSIETRHDIMSNISKLIVERNEELAIAESLDNGKPVSLARKVDIPRAASNFKFFANAITQYPQETFPMGSDAINYTLRQPLGVVATISPWNLPLYLFTWKIAPALAAGNTVVAKPSEVTPMTAFLLSEICMEAGLPKGVLNIIHGNGMNAGSPLTKHKDIKAISFTGSTMVGRQIAKIAAERFKKVSLEMGGKNPNIIFADCDFENMMSTTIRSSFANQGQICLCGSRILVEKSLYPKFKAEFTERVKKLKLMNPLSEEADMGAVVSEQHMKKVLSYIELAKEEGGTILTGGQRVMLDGEFKNGYYIAPTVIEGLTSNCRVNQEEIFGPVVTIMPFENEDEALALANDSQYGLSATVWTSNSNRSHRMAKKIEAGIVWINTWLLRDLRTPFGGVKNSGMGREGGYYALNFFTEAKNICIKYS